MAHSKTQISELYVAIFNRASEGSGNKYWQKLEKSLSEIADDMLATLDAKQYFGNSLDNNKDFIEHIYKNTLGKTYADDPEGIDYWVSRLDSGESRGNVITTLIQAAQDPKYSELDAYKQFKNRIEVSDYTSDVLEDTPENYKLNLGFDGNLQVTADQGTINLALNAISKIPSFNPTPGKEGVGHEPGSNSEMPVSEALEQLSKELEGLLGGQSLQDLLGPLAQSWDEIYKIAFEWEGLDHNASIGLQTTVNTILEELAKAQDAANGSVLAQELQSSIGQLDLNWDQIYKMALDNAAYILNNLGDISSLFYDQMLFAPGFDYSDAMINQYYSALQGDQGYLNLMGVYPDFMADPAFG